jgi:hypothetical protein
MHNRSRLCGATFAHRSKFNAIVSQFGNVVSATDSTLTSHQIKSVPSKLRGRNGTFANELELSNPPSQTVLISSKFRFLRLPLSNFWRAACGARRRSRGAGKSVDYSALW